MRKIRINWCDSEEARAYVASRAWEALSATEPMYTRHVGNSLWRTDVAPFGQVVVKEARLDGNFPLFERIGREIRFRTVNANLRDVKAALKAESLGVATYHPLAAWEVRDGLWTSRYLMYTYVEGTPLSHFCPDGAFDEADRPAIKRHLRELGSLARRLHEGGLRHRDLVPNNVVVRPDGSLAIIDFASGYPVRRRWSRHRMDRDFASLRRFLRIFDADCLYAFCEGYAGTARGEEFDLSLALALYWRHHRPKRRWGVLRKSFWLFAAIAPCMN